jgi:hypothetical protein
VGYSVLTTKTVERDRRSLIQIESVNRLAIPRSNTITETEIRLWSLETPEGRLLECESTIGGIMSTKGKVRNGRLEMVVSTRGKRVERQIDWAPEFGGFFAVRQTLAQTPMKPGQRRSVQMLEPTSNQLVVTELYAAEEEEVKLRDGARRLLRIEATTKLDDQEVREHMWVDTAGVVWKTNTEGLDLELYRTTKEAALAASSAIGLDLLWNKSVRIDQAIPRPQETKRIRYRVQVEGDTISRLFVTGATQQLRTIAPHIAELTVWAIRPGRRDGNADAPNDPPSAADQAPNSLVQSDDPRIASAAAVATAGMTDAWQIAVALERFTNEHITHKNYTRAFDTAADVMESRTGDCTEHAVLLAALLRSRAIPARVAIGLVYTDRAFQYHMWDEAYIEGRWIPLDAMAARGGIGAAYLKLAQGNLSGASAFTCILPVAQAVGRLKVEVLEVEHFGGEGASK